MSAQNTDLLTRIQQSVADLAERIGAIGTLLPTFGGSEDFARPHIEAIGETMYFVVVERGQELTREVFFEQQALLERIFRGIASEMASTFELTHRRPNEDPRRQMFSKIIDLLTQLDETWGQRERQRLIGILSNHPFCDDLEPKHTLP